MFGGLDLKGGDAKKKEEAPAADTPSAFAWMGSGTTTTTSAVAEEDSAVRSSGFSFLNNNSVPPNNNNNNNASEASAFSFMMDMAGGETSGDPPATATSTKPAESPPSSFSFLQQSSSAVPPETGDDGDDGDDDDGGIPPAASRSSSNGLGFLPSSDQTVSTISVEDLNVNNLPAEDLLPPLSSYSSYSQPLGGSPGPGVVSFGTAVGAGVTFGAVAPNKGRTVKKRTRTAKIGAAAASAPTSSGGLTTPMSMSQPTTGSAVLPEPTTTTLEDTRTAAELAARRAEEFLQQKMKQSDATPLHHTTKVLGDAPLKFTNNSSLSSSSPPAIVSVPSEEDEVIAAAKKAAQEAHKIEEAMQQQHNYQHSGRGVGAFSGLFRSRGRSPPATQSMRSLSASSSGGGGGALTMEAPPATGVERLQKEQEQVKRAMAERHLQMVQQQQQQQQSLSEESHPKPPAYPEHASSSSSLSMKPTGFAVGSGSSNTASSYAAPSSSLVPAQPNSPVKLAVVAPDVLSAPTPPTPMDQFHALLDNFRTNVIQSMDKVTRLRGHRTGLLEERFVTTAKERLAAQQIQQAEALQTAAAEAEDFELADQLSQTITRHAQEQAEYAAILESISRALTELEQQKQTSVRLVTQCFRDVQLQLQTFLQQQQASDTQDVTAALQTFSAVAKQLSAEHERLQTDWKHLERDAQAVAEERAELEKAISEQSGQFEQLRDQARAKLTTVEEEMEELRLQLQAKQAVAAQLRTEAAGHDEAVLKVRVKFARQLNRLQNKEVTMKDNQEEWELEKHAYEANKAQHDAQVHQHSEAMLARDQLLDALHRQVEMADTFESIVAKEIGFEANTNETADAAGSEPSHGSSDNDELAHLQANVVKCEAAVSESKAALLAVTTIVRNLEQEVQELERRIPMLEEAKTAAASKRDFKAAGKASREIKEAISRLAECQEELQGDATAKAEAAATNLAQHEHDLAEAQTVAQAKERESAAAAMAHLANHIRRLVATKHQVCSADVAKNPRSVPAVGALVLQAQIRALQMEGQTYGDKYGGWEELMAGIDGVDDNHNDNNGKNNETDDAEGLPQVLSGEDTVSASDGSTGRIEHDVVNTEGDSQEEKQCEVDADDSSPSLNERMRHFQNVARQLKEVEDQLEAAAVEEDYEKAAELDETLQRLLAEVETLNLTDEEMTAAMALPPVDDNLAAAVSVDETLGEVLTEAATLNAEDDANNDDENENDQEVMVPPVSNVQSGASVDGSQDDSPPLPDQLHDNGSVDAEISAINEDESAIPTISDSKSVDSKAEESLSNDHADTNGTTTVQSDDEE